MHGDDAFDAELVHLNGSMVIRLAGELDVSTAPFLAERLREFGSSHLRALVLDLSGLEFVDVAGLRGLLAAAWGAETIGASFQLLDPPPFALRLMGLVGFDALINAVDYSSA